MKTKKNPVLSQSRISPDDPNYFPIMMEYLSCLNQLAQSHMWISAFTQRGEKIPQYIIDERNQAISVRDAQILLIDPDYDFAGSKVKTRNLLGFKHTADVAGNPFLEELIGVGEIFSANLKTALGTISEPIAIPVFDSVTGEVQLNLEIGDVITFTFPEQ